MFQKNLIDLIVMNFRQQRGADQQDQARRVHDPRHVRAVPEHHEDGSLRSDHGNDSRL